MQHIVFNRTDYNAIPHELRKYYKSLGGNVYALEPARLKISLDRLPKWLSREQYAANIRLVGPYYQLVTRGFQLEAVPLMQLIPKLSLGIRTQYKASTLPKTTRITETAYWQLPATERSKYQKVMVNGTVFYANKRMSLNKVATIAKPGVRPPTVGIKIPPSGSWVEVP